MFRFDEDARAAPTRVGHPALGTARASAPAVDAGLLLAILRRRLGLVALAGIMTVALAVVALAGLPPAYTAGIQILLDPSDLRVLENEVTPRAPQADAGVSLAESQVRVIQSGAVLRRVVERLDLDRDPAFVRPETTNPVLVALKRVLGTTPPGPSEPVHRAIDTLDRALTVRRAERTFVIDVAVRAPDPTKAAAIANAVGAAYLAEEAAARAQSAKRVAEGLTARFAALQGELAQAENRVVAYRREHALVSARGSLLTDQQLGDLNQQVVTAAIRTAEARTRTRQAEAMRALDTGTALPEMLQSPEMQGLRQQYAALARARAETATRLGARHPALLELDAQLREAAQRIESEKRRIVEATTKETVRATESEAAIRRQLAQARSELLANESAVVGLAALERERDARRAVYENVLRRAQEAGEQERLNALNVRIISDAVPPLQRSWPPSPRLVLPAALLLGLLVGAGLVLAPTLAAGVRRPPAGARPASARPVPVGGAS